MSDYINKQRNLIILFIITILTGTQVSAQNAKRIQPVWWFGQSGAVNFNTYRGTTQKLNNEFTVPMAFHKGKGLKPYASILTEYRPNKKWGGMLQLAFDNRGGKFNGVTAPCNCAADLSTNLSYLTIEPSLRLAPFSSAFYIFAGPTANINISKKFVYTQEKQFDTRADWSDVRKVVIAAQAGMGIDIPLSAPANNTQITLSPFASFITDLIQTPRTVESWSFYTIRAGVALKFGGIKKSVKNDIADQAANTESLNKQVQFSVEGPQVSPLTGLVKETFPLRNTIFFDRNSTEIPKRYVLLNASSAKSFHEEQLQNNQPQNLATGRSSRQLVVYHNILNIVGDRMRENPSSKIKLMVSGENNSTEGKIFADNITNYLHTVFNIDPSRTTVGTRARPVASQQTQAINNAEYMAAADRSVDIESNSPELLLQVGGTSMTFLKPVQITTAAEDPLNRQVNFKAIGASELFESWSVHLTDDEKSVQVFGPFTNDSSYVAANAILGDHSQGNYIVKMVGKTKAGTTVTKESRVSLIKAKNIQQEGLRYSILFDFDQSRSIDAYDKFLTDMVAPLVTNNSIVKIHGHTDVIGDERYNLSLSHDRATGVQQVIERALIKAGRTGVKFETSGFGSSFGMSPFENKLPEERSYNRTVIIEILPAI